MAETPRELVVLITHGMDDERSSVAFTIANGGITAGLQVSIFLTSAAVDLVRKRAIEGLVVHPARAAGRVGEGFSRPRRPLVGLHAVRQGAGLPADRPHRWGRDHRCEQDARADQGRRGNAQLLT